MMGIHFFLYICSPIAKKALVAELVDALDSKSSSFGSVGSIPTQGTKKRKADLYESAFFVAFFSGL